MEYRKMENLGISTSLLGFGCMRFPTTEDGSIDEKEALAMIDTAYQSGVTYFDTAYPYHGGTSEVVTGKALARYQETRIIWRQSCQCGRSETSRMWSAFLQSS